MAAFHVDLDRDERDLRSLAREASASGTPGAGGRFPYARLVGGALGPVLFSEATFEGLNAAGARFDRVRFVRCAFSGSDLHDVAFEHCVFSEVRFEASQLRGVRFVGCTFDRCQLGPAPAPEAPHEIRFEACLFLGMGESSGLAEWARLAELDRCLFVDFRPLPADRLRESGSAALGERRRETAKESPAGSRVAAPPSPVAPAPAAEPAASAPPARPADPSRFSGLDL